MGLTFVVSKLPTSPKGSAFELFYVSNSLLSISEVYWYKLSRYIYWRWGKIIFHFPKERNSNTHTFYSPLFSRIFCVLQCMPVWSIWQLFLSAFNNWPCAKQHLVVSFVTSDSVSGKVRSRSSEEPRDRQAQAVALFFIFMYSHSAVFKFGGLLRLLDINLTKQDKPIS